jgi:cell division septation protein DedD
MSRMTQTGEEDVVDHDEPRSIFATLWFRALLVVLVVGAVAAVAVPYVLDIVNPPAAGPTLASAPRPSDGAVSLPGQPPSPALPSPQSAAAVAPSAETPTPAAAATPPPGAASPTPESAAAGKPSEPHATATGGTEPASPPAPADKPATTAADHPVKARGDAARAVESAGSWWVQVGAFRDAAAARRLAARLREQNYPVEEAVKRSPTATVAAAATGDTSSDRYDVFVSGLAPAAIQSRLAAKGLAAEPVAGGAVVTPSLPLREAVTLSRELAAEGLTVQVRRRGGGTPSPATPTGGDQAMHRVRVGAFPNREAALAVARELEARGYKPFVARDGS